MECISLSSQSEWLKDYISLRNKNSSLLLTQTVGMEETKSWLEHTDASVRLLIDNKSLKGCYILYPSRSYEFAFFTNQVGKGYGSQLIKNALVYAKDNGAQFIWAKTLSNNSNAHKCFLKNGFNETKPKDLAKNVTTINDDTSNLLFFTKNLA